MATGYNRVYNTVLSGNEAQSSLSGDDVRMLEFDAALKRRPAVVLAAGDNSLSVQDWMQASIDTLVLDPTIAGEVNLGTDSVTQAAAYVQLFDLRSTNEQRLLRMAIQKAVAAAGTVELKNSSGAANNVQVLLDGAGAAATQTLFVQANAVTGSCSGARAGVERIVLVSASNLNSGAQVVQFNVLSGSL